MRIRRGRKTDRVRFILDELNPVSLSISEITILTRAESYKGIKEMDQKIRIQKLDSSDDVQLGYLVCWDNDPGLIPFISPVRNLSHQREDVTLDGLREKYQEKDPGIYIIFDKAKPIGNFSLSVDPELLFKKQKGTGWLGITMGDKDYWGTGAAIEAINYFENLCREQGLNRVELGVFEYNLRALNFYRKLGYIEIGRIPDFTYFEGRAWEDIRLEKKL